MKKALFTLSALILSLSVLSGCRREDIREVSVELPKATAADVKKMQLAFVIPGPHGLRDARVCDGIDLESFKFDDQKKTLTMRYDSMKTAHTNIRMLLQGAGFEVVFPENNKNGVAGYLDVKPASVD